MKLSEAIREWKRNITTNMAVEYVLTLRADINAFSDAAQALEMENAKLRELVNDMWICIAHGSEGWDCTGCRRDPDNVCIMGISEFSHRMRELGIEVE